MADLRINETVALPLEKSRQKKTSGPEGFGDLLEEAVGKVHRLEGEANRSLGALLEGKADIAEYMMASQKVDLSMRLLLTVRNKVIEAYKEIMHMQF
jgi:flagellar hook-basal body complex protein FliE